MDSIDRESRFDELIGQLGDRAEEAPWLVAARIGQEAVTYGSLADDYQRYRRVTGCQAMSPLSALVAAVVHQLPSIGQLQPDAAARTVGRVIAWLGRDLPEQRGGLVAV